jgi:hypothetical protein
MLDINLLIYDVHDVKCIVIQIIFLYACKELRNFGDKYGHK